jgi:hypothetical protein
MPTTLGIAVWNWGRMIAEGKTYTSLLLCSWSIFLETYQSPVYGDGGSHRKGLTPN